VTSFDRRLRLAIYIAFRDTGLRPTSLELSNTLKASEADIHAGLERLAEARVIALEPDSSSIWMAHPFSGVPTGFSSTMDGVSYTGNCAWDIIAIAAILGVETTIEFTCHATGAAESVSISKSQAVGSGVIHHVVPAKRFWDDVGFT
jgi:hypothetical protein